MITSLTFWLIVWGIIAAIGLALACTLIGGGKGTHKRDRAPLFRSQDDALDWQAAEPLPPLPPFPGDEPQDTAPAFLPAPVTPPLDPSAVLTPAEAARIHDPADDSIWDRHGILREQLWARLNAEAVGSNG